MNTKDNTQVGFIYIPEGGPKESGIEVIEINDKGVKVKRLHPYHNGEEFFLTWETFGKSKWVR